MNEKLKKTLSNRITRSIFCSAVHTFCKSFKILAERGADQGAMSFIKAGLEKIIDQLKEVATEIEFKNIMGDFFKEEDE